MTSTRRKKLRGIQSALEMKISSSSPAGPNANARLCSRNRPTTLGTRMVSETFGTPGRRQQIPRIPRSIGTPALEAR